MTFLSELTTQSNTAFSFGTRLIVLSGRSTRSTLSDLMVERLLVISLPPSPLKLKKISLDCHASARSIVYLRHIESNADNCTTDDDSVH